MKRNRPSCTALWRVPSLALTGWLGLMVCGPGCAERYTGPWDLGALQEPPAVQWGETDGCVRSLYYAGEPYAGKPTRVFAYYATPADTSRPVPGMVLVHGGGGKAFKEWVQLWSERGYAAIAMDLAGCGPDGECLPDGGPDQSHEAKFDDIARGVKMAWPYHAVANVILAHSLIRNFPEVDADRTGITGISWGGYLTCIVAGLDNRFKVAVPVYGCGYFHEDKRWARLLNRLSPERRRQWIEYYDPSCYLPGCRIPILFINGTNDPAFPLDSYQKSYRLVRGPRTVCVTVNMKHSHPHGWAPKEIGIFADAVLRYGKPLTRFMETRCKGREVVASFRAAVPVKEAALHYTTDGGPWKERKWQTLPAQLDSGHVKATLPTAAPVTFFLTVTDERGAVVSSEHEVLEPARTEGADSEPVRCQAESETARFDLPAWFEGNRVQAHSEHGLRHALTLTPRGHAKAIRSLGANVLTRIFLTRDEGAWWPSKVGEIHPLIGERDFAAEIVQAVHGEGMKVIAYHRHMCDAAMQAQHPDWACRHPDGSPVLEPRGKTKTVFVLCMNLPYRDYIKTRLLELADRGVECIYFDSWHMPDICACDFCKKAFREEMGHELDLSAPAGSPGYLEGVDFVNRTMVSTFQEWRETVRSRHPHVFFAIGSSRYPMFFSPHIDSRLVAISDTSKTEFHKPFGGNTRVMAKERDFAMPSWDDQLALGWSLVRDGSNGRPPLMWIPWIRNERQARYSAAAAVTYGCVASMSVTLRALPRDAQRARELFPSTFAMGHKVSPYLANARPVPWAALHVSEHSRNARLADTKQMWREVFSPALGAVQMLREAHVPWVTLTDDALAQGPEPRTKVLVLPWPDELNKAQRATVTKFEQAGGVVVRLDPRAGWHHTDTRPGLMQELRRLVRERAVVAPVDIQGPKTMHAVWYHESVSKRHTVCLANTWGWFRSTRKPDPKLNQVNEPAPCSGVTVNFAPRLGRPKRVFEALSGTPLTLETSTGGTRVALPDFQIQACVVAEF